MLIVQLELKIASLTSISYNKFGDLKQGSNRSPFLQDFGSRNWFVSHTNGEIPFFQIQIQMFR